MEALLNLEPAKTLLDINEIQKIIPHRYPFLLVDKIIAMDLEAGSIVGQKNVTMNEEFFQGHFPEAPIMPGVLILEALAQTGGVLIHQRGHVDKTALLLSMNNVKFRTPVKPGDVLQLHIKGVHLNNKAGRVEAKATVDGKVVVQAEIGFVLVDKNKI